ncbi:MAG: hypothetical protein QM733_16215 [Ilumatobacteraceae bacterium]
MPWCEDCAKYWTPSAMNADGTCPTCGRALEATKAEPITAKNLDLKKLAAGEEGDEESAKAPWHFKLLLVLLALYLTWRVIDLFR